MKLFYSLISDILLSLVVLLEKSFGSGGKLFPTDYF